MELKTNVLYYGDNLEILRKYIPDESIDLIYLDPPFNSQADYNVLFREPTGELSEAQIRAFSDTWHWDLTAERAFEEIVTTGPPQVAKMISALRDFVGRNDVMAYLVMMTARLVELRRVLKPTGALFLHCDPTASHYLKIVLDTVFGKQNFRNEIVWRRSHPKGHAFIRFARNHDVILAFAKDAALARWDQQYTPHDPERAAKQYPHVDETGRRYQLTSLLNPNRDRPHLTYEFKGVTKVWRWTRERMLEEDSKGRIVVPRGGQGIPRYKRYLDEQEGIPVADFWADIDFAAGRERLSYPTQKPLALLERIINASSNEGDVVLDPFCGCGTAVVAAHKLNRRWIGIDITHLAITVMKERLRDSFSGIEFEVVGEPADVASAQALAEQDRYQFEWWALSLVNAKPVGDDRKKGRDRGIDGVIGFVESGGKAKRVIVQVKSGHINPGHIRDLKGTMQREKAEIGLFLTLEPPTQGMVTEAASAGFYHSDLWNEDYPRIQICTIEELLEGKLPKLPRWAGGGFPKAQKIARKEGKQAGML